LIGVVSGPSAGGVFRLAIEPDRAPRPADTRVLQPGRFDDPERLYRVVYMAASLLGCLLEKLNGFREHEATMALLLNVADVIDTRPVRSMVTEGWIAVHRLHGIECQRELMFIDVHDARTHAELNTWLDIQAALYDTRGPDCFVDFGTIQLAGADGRRITQAISRGVYERLQSIDGLAYRSRLEPDIWCWAAYADRVDGALAMTEGEALVPDNPTHRAALNSAALRLNLRLPDRWSEPVQRT
jgi:hypothetical protein